MSPDRHVVISPGLVTLHIIWQVSASALLDTSFLLFFFRIKCVATDYHGAEMLYQTLLTFLVDPTRLAASITEKVRETETDPIYGQ